MLRKTRVVSAAAAFALTGAALFGGAAMAGGGHGHGHGHDDDYVGGAGGAGGNASSECVLPIGVSVGALIGSGGDVSQCNATGGAGGAGGAGGRRAVNRETGAEPARDDSAGEAGRGDR